VNKNPWLPVVLVCPLDWGLGHATRCVPVIRELLLQGVEVVIAGDGQGMNLLAEEFPHLKQEYLKGYQINFSKRLSVCSYLLLNIPRLITRIIKEHFQLRSLIRKTNASAVISDNRYGLWNKGIYTVFITHQPNIIPPTGLNFIKPALRYITRSFIRRYNECWIPDEETETGLSGKLSHGFMLPGNVRYIGPLSRFENEMKEQQKHQAKTIEGYDIVGIVSGPEPQRTQFEKTLYEQFSVSSLKCLLVRGKLEEQDKPVVLNNLTIINHARASQLYQVLLNSKVVICRGGYSTLMDLSFTGNRSICIPTPGQSEQEYLAGLAALNGYTVNCHQKEFNLNKCYEYAINTKPFSAKPGKIAQAVGLMLNKLQ
jgi:UDP:flavonoid glycosyltransferase YjiC (YdhE family)